MIVWDESIRVGIASVDDDHRSILDHINRFIEVIEQRSNVAEIHAAFRDMETCIYRHLGDEEQMLAAVGFEATDDHALAHDNLTQELADIWDDMLADPDFRPDEAARGWLAGWLFQHVKTEDFRYRDWIFDRSLEGDAEAAMKLATNRSSGGGP